MGQIHTFILPSLLTEGRQPPLTTFIRRVVHYMHNAYIVNDFSDRGHLLFFSTMNDARDFLSLITLAVFLNVLDERTYRLSLETYQKDPAILQQCHDIFDLNAIPVIERHHLCYIRSLSFDLLNWFFENYSFASVELEEDDMEPFSTVFIPFIIHIGRQIVKYKYAAEDRGITTAPSISRQVHRQVQSALFGLEFARDAWLEEKAVEEERDYHRDIDGDEGVDFDSCDLDYDFSGYTITRREIPADRTSIDDFLEAGKSNADRRFFRGLDSEFKVKKIGEYSYINIHILFGIPTSIFFLFFFEPNRFVGRRR